MKRAYRTQVDCLCEADKTTVILLCYGLAPSICSGKIYFCCRTSHSTWLQNISRWDVHHCMTNHVISGSTLILLQVCIMWVANHLSTYITCISKSDLSQLDKNELCMLVMAMNKMYVQTRLQTASNFHSYDYDVDGTSLWRQCHIIRDHHMCCSLDCYMGFIQKKLHELFMLNHSQSA